MREPRRDHYIEPATGPDSEHVIDDAIASLRDLPWLGDPGATLHLLTSLIHQAQQQLPRAVANARDQNYSWAQIADLLGTTRASAWVPSGGGTHLVGSRLPQLCRTLDIGQQEGHRPSRQAIGHIASLVEVIHGRLSGRRRAH